MNRRIVSALLGYLTLFCGAAMIPPFLLAAIEQEFDGAAAFLLSIFLCLAATFELERFGGLQDKDNLGIREGIAITGLGWLLMSILGLVPYFAGGYLNFLDSLVESISGFSGTGATVINDVEILPRSILLWRSMSNWFGGLGIVVIFMAIMPQFGRGGMYILKAETTGPTKERQMPRIRDNAKALFSVYVALTIICSASYFLCGLSPFASINHAMTTIATGGYGIYNGTVSEYGNAYLEYCMAFFMVVSSGSFAMYVVAFRRGIGTIFKNTEFRTYLMIVALASAVIAVDLYFEMGVDIEKATRVARAMITQYGMSERFGLINLESEANQYLEGRMILNCSDVTAAQIDEEVMAMLKEAYAEAKNLLTGHRQTLDKIAAFLIERETMTGKEFMDIFYEAEGIEPEEKTDTESSRIGLKSTEDENN